MREFLVVKLTDNGITNYMIRNEIRRTVQALGGMLLETPATKLEAHKFVTVEDFIGRKDFIEFTKKQLSLAIGEYALKDGLITFTETQKQFGTDIGASLIVLNLDLLKGSESDA